MYGSLPAAEGQCQSPSRRVRPVVGSLLIFGLALSAVCMVVVVHMTVRPVVLESDSLISADQAGLLGRVHQNKENTIGDLATITHAQPKTPLASAAVSGLGSNMQRAMAFKQHALKLQQAKKKLEEQEKKIDAMTKADFAKYAKAMQQARASKITPAAAPKQTQGNNAAMAKEVASLVLETIEPQLQEAQQQIAKLSATSAHKTAPSGSHVAQPPKHPKGEAKKPSYPPAFPANFHHAAEVKTPVHPKSKEASFQKTLRKFLGQTGVNNRVHGHQKSMVDYKMDNGEEDPGQGAEPEDEVEWAHPESKGGPCSVSGKCNHGAFKLQDHEYWQDHKLGRWKKGEDGNGHAVEGEDKDEDESDEDEDKEDGDDEEVHLGNEELMRSLDDYVTPDDAYLHNLLTSGAYGIDHFGKLSPMSKENQVLMYGSAMPEAAESILGKELNSPGKGGAHSEEVEERRSSLGDDRIGDDDIEIPVGLSMPAFPTEDYDHFDHWKHNSPENQELLNGKYWKRLKKDGFLDRLMPADEAHAHQIGDSHDRHPIPDLAFNSWHQGFGYGPSEEHPSPFMHAREEVHGKDWREHVFTGTHENMEHHKGVVGNMIKDGAYFKHNPATDKPMLRHQV